MKTIFTIIFYILFCSVLFARGELGGLSYGTAKMIYEQDGKFVIKLPSGEMFDFASIFTLPQNQQMAAWKKFEKKLGIKSKYKSVKDPMKEALKIIKRETEILNAGIDQISGKKKHNKKYDEYILTNSEIKSKVKKQFSYAFSNNLKMCKQGNAGVCLNLGKHYMTGIFLDKNMKHAEYFFKRACRLGAGEGCFNYGRFFSKRKKLKYYKQACNMHYYTACLQLGYMYGKAKGGVRQDKAKGKMYLMKACNAGRRDVCRYYKELKKHGFVN